MSEINIGVYEGALPSICRNRKWFVLSVFEGQIQYLHKDGTWHHTFDTDHQDGTFPGLFDTHEQSQQAFDRVGPPTKLIENRVVRCKKCKHIFLLFDDHVCPPPEYIEQRDQLISDVAEEDEQYRNANPETER